MNEDKTEEPVAAAKETGSVLARKKVLRKVKEDEKLPLTVHLEELRWRIINCAVTVSVCFVVLYAVSDYLFELIRKPIGIDLVFLAPAEAFFVYLKISVYMAIFVSVPMILYQAWEFLAPGLLQSERKYTGAFVLSGVIFFLIGATFCYTMVLPYGLSFLIGYGGEGLTPMISVGNYISSVFKLTLAFGTIFEMPIVIVFLTKLGFVDPHTLGEKRSYFIVGSFVAASILTPPDVFTQIIMAVPMILLFELSVIVSKFFVNEKKGEDN